MADTSADISADKDTDMANDDIIVNIPDMAFDEKVAKFEKLVDDLLKNYNKDDKQPIDKRLKEFLESENFKSKDNKISQLKSLIEDNTPSLLKNGHIQLDNDKLILELFNNYATKCIKEEKLEFMIVVAVLLPDLVKKSYKSIVSDFMMQLSYIKIPPKWCKGKEHEHTVKFHSIRENLWSYKFPDHESSMSPLNRLFKTTYLHTVTLCYVPLPGLCTYPECTDVFDILFPRHPSPFVQLIITHTPEIFNSSHASSKIYESAPFQAIIKFKWLAFARWRFYVLIFFYFNYFIFFTAAIFKTTTTTESRQLMIASMIFGVTLILCWIRYTIIIMLNGASTRFFSMPTNYMITLELVLPIITGLLFLKYGDNTILPVLQYLSIAFLWLGLMGCLLIFKNIGIFIIVIMQICRRIVWLLFLLVVFLFASAHSMLVLLAKESEGGDAFSTFDKSFKNLWSGLLGNYDSLKPWEGNPWVVISMIVFSISTYIIILNILIALVNNVYDEVNKRARTEWNTIRARFIAFVELLLMLPSERQNRDYFPPTITYEALTEEVNEWPKILKNRKISNLWVEEITEKFLAKFIKLQKVTDQELQSKSDY